MSAPFPGCGGLRLTRAPRRQVPIAGWAHTAFGGDSTADDMGKYIMSYYWSMMTLTTVGYGDIPSNTLGEQARCRFVS